MGYAIGATAGIGLSADFPVAVGDEVLAEGDSLLSAGNKDSGFLAEPLLGGEGILVADCDLRSPLAAKGDFDATGHYSREDVLIPLLSKL